MRAPVKLKAGLVALATSIVLASTALGQPAPGAAPAIAPPGAGPAGSGATWKGPGPGKGAGRGPGGGRPMGPPPWMRGLYGPWIVLSNKDALGLRPEQVEALEKIMRESKSKRDASEEKLRAASDALTKATSAAKIDTAAALAKFDEVSAAEQRARREGFETVLDVRKVLDAEQVEKLRGLARPAGRGPGSGPRGPGLARGGRPATGTQAPAAAAAAPSAPAPTTH